MADTKITDMTASSALTGAEVLPIVQSAANVKATTQKVVDAAMTTGLTRQDLGSINTNTTIDWSLGSYVTATITGALTFTFSNPAPSGKACVAYMQLTNAESATITWPVSVTWSGGTKPTLRTSGVDLLRFYTQDGGTTWFGTSENDEQAASSGGALQIDYYTSGSGTWTKHPSAKLVRILAVGGGGAGGGGDRRDAGSDLRGGGAGGAGCIVDMYIPADQLGSTEAYSVGSGGVGGTGATAVGSGNNGTAGGNTTFGTSFLVAKGGEQGYSGGGSGNAKLNGCFLLNVLHSTTNGGTGSGGLGHPGGTPSGTTAIIPTAGGGGGGMNSSSSTIGGGGAGGKPHSNFYTHVIQTDPAAAGGAINGGDGAHGVSKFGIGWGGGGGGCGSVDGTIRGGDGGNGGFPGGGGGGGGGARGVRGGNGGNGGGGMLMIIQF